MLNYDYFSKIITIHPSIGGLFTHPRAATQTQVLL